MKKGLTSLDVYFLVLELNRLLDSARVDKVYQISERVLKIRLRIPGEGSSDIVVAPDYLCVTRYPRDVPEQPSSFAMQLRKYLKGSMIKEVRQHGFDRIIEFRLERVEQSYTLIVELFSKGNVVLCDSDGYIIGLLEWQKWRDRRLGVGQRYEHPPAGRNPFEVDLSAFSTILKESGKSLGSTLATDVGLGGVYAEEVCRRSGIDREKRSNELSREEAGVLFEGFQWLLGFVREGVLKPVIVLDEQGEYVDVLPFPLDVYVDYEKKNFTTLNDAVDTYFSEEAFTKQRDSEDERIREKIEKISGIEEKQRKTIRELEDKAEEYRRVGDVIYQNIQALNRLLEVLREEKKKGATWSRIGEQAAGKSFNGIGFVDVDDKGIVTLEVGE